MKHLNSITVALFLSAASVVALTACGGGGSGDTSAGSGGTGGSSSSTNTESTSSSTPSTGSESTSSSSTNSSSSSSTTTSSSSSSTTTSSSSGGMAGGASLSKDVQPILTANCAKAGCHAGNVFPNLSEGKTATAITNKSNDCAGDKVVTPGSPTKSSLYNKIAGTSCGQRMPKGAAALSDDKIKTIEDWITAGAKND